MKSLTPLCEVSDFALHMFFRDAVPHSNNAGMNRNDIT